MPKQTFFNLPDVKSQHIIEVAIDEFSSHGYKGASISRMVATAGIAKGSFYQYFEDLDDLYIYIVQNYIAQKKLAVFQEEAEQLKTLSLTEFLRLVFHRQIREFAEHPQLLRIGMELMQLVDQPVFRKIMKKYEGTYNTYFIPFLQHEVDQGEIDSRVNLQLLNSMLVSLGQYMLYYLNATDTPAIIDSLVDQMVDDLEFIFIHGIYTAPPK